MAQSILRLSLISALLIMCAKPLEGRYNDSIVFSFEKIKPNANLFWIPCFDNFACANLKVPLDYTDPTVGTTNIAFIKKASSNESAEDIIINPGGPSNSGIQFLITGAPLFEALFGSRYNLISFDPRGVNNSGPVLTCFPRSEAAQTVFGRTLGLPIDSNSSTATAEAFELAKGWGQWCTQENTGSNAKYANTPAVATDMLHFIGLRSMSRGRKAGDAKLWYYGLSYGSVIGMTFASLYPDKVARMILDAPMDMEDYYSGRSRENLWDADAAVQYFFQTCYEAGRDACALYAESPEAVEARFTRVMQGLKARPIVVTEPFAVQMPTLATFKTLQSFILQATLVPTSRFPTLAQLFAGLEKGNGSAIAKNSGFGALAEYCPSNPETRIRNYHMEEPRLIILCNDANGRENLSSIENFEKQVDYLVKQSYYLGESWAGATGVNCASLDLRPPKSQQFSGYISNSTIQTSSPILFLSNTIDPTSPLRGARRMASLFRNSALLTINGVGHGSITAPSNCTLKHVRTYIATGALPPVNSTCVSESLPFIGTDGGLGKVLKSVY